MDDDTDPAFAIWNPVSDLNDQHVAAFSDLNSAFGRGDLEACREAMRRIHSIEEKQKSVHAAVRAYLVNQLRGQDSVQG